MSQEILGRYITARFVLLQVVSRSAVSLYPPFAYRRRGAPLNTRLLRDAVPAPC